MVKRLSKNEKIILIILFGFFLLFLLFLRPTLARFKYRSISTTDVWSGNIATSYKSGTGTVDNPYIISNGEELAYFAQQLETNHYEGVYFKLNNHIRINEGTFQYNEKLEYVIGNNTYYVKNNSYYEDEECEQEAIGTIHLLPSLDGFKGHFDGTSHVIYGFYQQSDNAGLFTELKGEVKDLYISNSFIEGNNSGILSNNITNGIVQNVMVDGIILSDEYEGEDEILDVLETNNYTVSGGLTAYAKNTSFTNCINKSEIIGSFLSGGLVGVLDSSSMVNAYSTSNLTSYSSNTIGIIRGNSSINRIYNTGEINDSLIGYVMNSECVITNSFITTDNNIVGYVDNNSTITSNNNYFTNYGRGENVNSTLVSSLNLKDKTFLTSYSEFVDFDDLEINAINTWIFEEDNYPVLYIDDITNPYVELNLGVYMWNSFSTILDTKKMNNNITFLISDIDYVHDYNKYYFISTSQTPLTKTELSSVEWIPYTEMVQITEEGYYVVYVKVENGNEYSYINSDILVIDKSEPTIDITIGEAHYTSLNEETVFFHDTFYATLTAEDALSGIKSIEYYISNAFIDDYDVHWLSYTSPIQFNQAGEYVLYVKVTDGCDFVSYASTPLIIYDGYTSTIHPLGFETGNIITSNSTIVYNFSYQNDRELDLTHTLISNIVLPRHTEITLIDKENNKFYGYTINSNDDFGYELNNYASYPFTLFQEKGKNDTVFFEEGEVSNEDWEILLDFSNTNIEEDIEDIDITLEGYLEELVRPTINHSLFSIDTDRNVKLTHSITTNYNGSITYNSDSENVVAISSLVNYTTAYDTNYFDKKIGLSIKLVDASGRIVSKEHLKNMIFTVGEDKYTPSLDNIIRINLNTNSSTNTNLTITTHRCTPRLREGTYYIKINAYSSYDGLFYDSVIDNGIMIPVVVSKNINNSDYGFDVSIASDNRIINKGETANLSFDIKQSGLENPNIKISMYEKDEITAYNQDYSIVDLGFYSDIETDPFITNVYYLSRNPEEDFTYSFHLDTALLNRTSYKFVFDLYDGDLLVNSISKNIIVR